MNSITPTTTRVEFSFSLWHGATYMNGAMICVESFKLNSICYKYIN